MEVQLIRKLHCLPPTIAFIHGCDDDYYGDYYGDDDYDDDDDDDDGDDDYY